jgi:hypothetical protein
VLTNGRDAGQLNDIDVRAIRRKTDEFGSATLTAGRSKETTMTKIIGNGAKPTPPAMDPKTIDDKRQPAVKKAQAIGDENQASPRVEASKIIGSG